MDVERLLLRVVSYGSYAAGAGGLAFAIGDWRGWLVVAVAGAIPGGYLLAKQVEHEQIRKAQEKFAPESWTAPAQRGGPAPDPLTLPPSH